MKTILFVLAVFNVLLLQAQVTFQKLYYNDVPAFSTVMQTATQTSDGGMLMIGTNSSSLYSGCLLVVKTDSLGNMLWSKHYDTLYNFVLPRRVIETQNFDFVITGKVSSPLIDNSFILRLDDTGKVIFARRYAGGGLAIAENSNRELISVGVCQAPNGGIHLMKTDSSGIPIWSHIYMHASPTNFWSKDVILRSDGNIVIAGEAPTGNIPNDLSLSVFDSLGNFLWSKSYGGIYQEILYASAVCSDGGFLLGGRGYSFTTNHTVGSGYLIKTDSIGNLLWTKHLPDSNVGRISSIKETKDHNIIVATDGMQLIKFNEFGNFLWARTHGPQPSPATSCIARENKNGLGYQLVGSIGYPATTPLPDFYLIKSDNSGNNICLSSPVIPTIIDTISQTHNVTLIHNGSLDSSNTFPVYAHSSGKDTTLCSGIINAIQSNKTEQFSVFPNPSSGHVTFFSSTQMEYIEIISTAGQIVYRDNPRSSKANIELKHISPGIYFYEVIIGITRMKGKLLLN